MTIYGHMITAGMPWGALANSHASQSEMLKTTAIRSARACPTRAFSPRTTLRSLSAPTYTSTCCLPIVRAFSFNVPRRTLAAPAPPDPTPKPKPSLRENVYTFPNVLTVSRIVACPVLGWSILSADYHLATGLLVYAGLTDLADGWIARRYKMSSVLGTILDPAADKALMTTLTVSLAMQDLIPTPLAAIILGRDALLVLSAFWIRYTTLPHPKTFARYWDFSLPSAEVRPTMISKVNTALQLLLMGVTTVTPTLPFDLGLPLQGLQLVVAMTTIWSGMSYLFNRNAVRIVRSPDSKISKPPS